MFFVGQPVKIIRENWSFSGKIGTITGIGPYYVVKLLQPIGGIGAVYCEQWEIEPHIENIMDYVKQIILRDI